jgi:AraC-like DNA-binding protein
MHAATVEEVATIEALRRNERGYFAGETWVYFRWSSVLHGLLLFGRPTRADAEALSVALTLDLAPGTAPHAFYVDAQHLAGADPDAFESLAAVYRAHLPRAEAIYTKLALVVAQGVAGAVVAGFHGGATPPFPMRADADGRALRAWLDAPEALHEALVVIMAARRATPALVLQLRAQLAVDPTIDDAEVIARALGMSARTLQRRLQEAGTTLAREVLAQRIELAKRRLVETETPITVVAVELGFATSQHFSRTFREATGMTPSAWRARHRQKLPPSDTPAGAGKT